MDPTTVHVAVAAATEAPEGFSILRSVLDAGPIGMGTMLLLLGFSVASWAIILLKATGIRRAMSESEEFLDVFWQSKKLDEIYRQSEERASSPIAQVFRAGYQELVKVKQREQQDGDHKDAHLMGGAENIERSLRRAAATEMTELERLVPFLATVGSTAPFIGLFGTVVGIINAFADIARFKSASLTTVAPGIAEALVATAAGLLAAIPAVIAYNAFGARIRVIGQEMESFSSDFMNIVRRNFF